MDEQTNGRGLGTVPFWPAALNPQRMMLEIEDDDGRHLQCFSQADEGSTTSRRSVRPTLLAVRPTWSGGPQCC